MNVKSSMVAAVVGSCLTCMAQGGPEIAGGAVLLTPGGPGLAMEVDVQPGVYAISMVARSESGSSGIDLMKLDVLEQGTGRVRTWTMPVAYSGQTNPVGSMYFPAHAGGRYTVTASVALAAANVTITSGTLPVPGGGTANYVLDPATKALTSPAPAPLLVDRLELRDAWTGCAKQGFKTRRMLTSDAELAKIRQDFTDGKIALNTPNYDTVRNANLGDRTQRNDNLWNRAPDFNELTRNDGTYDIHGWMLGRVPGMGAVAESADWYEKTGNTNIGWDCAVLLCALAEKYPGFDPGVQLAAGSIGTLRNAFGTRNTYGDATGLATAYDRLFDFIKNNAALAAYLGGKVAWVQTPADVVRFLDVNLLQVAYVVYGKDGFPSDTRGAAIPAVQGVCADSDRMLNSGVFTVFVGVLPTEFYFYGPLNDISYASPFRPDIWAVAPYLHAYYLAGGAGRYDLMVAHPGFSVQREIEQWEQAHLSGGYRAASPSYVKECRSEFLPGWGDRGPASVFGHMKMFVIITNSSPSRILENMSGMHVGQDWYSLSILERGQFQADLLKMRSAWVQYNTMGLPLQATAHGGLSLTHFNKYSHQDFGDIAPGGSLAPTYRFLNVVQVDSLAKPPRTSGANELPLEGTAFPIGMNRCFASLSGVQFMEHTQTAFSNLTLYVRQTAMIDVGDAESYLFDVVRARGGRTHTYCLNAFPGAFGSNMQLVPVATTVNPLLQGYHGAMQSEGINPAVIRADWAMAPVLQEANQRQNMAMTSPADQQRHLQDPNFYVNQYDSNRVVTTRLSLLGHSNDLAMVGRWSTVNPTLDYWNLYVQGTQGSDGRESVYPGIIETFAGVPFLGEKRLLSVSPAQSGAEAAVGVEVRTASGRTDWVYAGVRPLEMATLESSVSVSGRFALVSWDSEGLRKLALVAGTALSGSNFLVAADSASRDMTVEDVDYDSRTFTVAEALPTGALKDAYVTGTADGRLRKFKLTGLERVGEGTRLSYDRQIVIHQSNLTGVDEAQNLITTAMQPFRVEEGMTVTNEKRDKFWKVTEFLQSPLRWRLNGAVRSADFTDEDGDGKIKVSAGFFGPGDRLTADTQVNVERKARGVYEVEANVGCRIGLPRNRAEEAAISADGVRFDPVPAVVEGDRLTVTLTESNLVGGRIELRLISPLSVRIVSPTNGADFLAPAAIPIAVEASDTGASVTNVAFYQDVVRLSEDSAAPYEFVWSNMAARAYSLTARAYNSLGEEGVSEVVNVTVTSPFGNEPPAVALTAPPDGGSYAAPATLSLAATATDNDGVVVKVEFFEGTNKLGEDLTAPYGWVWSGVPVGSYRLTAVATDDGGATATSGPSRVVVSEFSGEGFRFGPGGVGNVGSPGLLRMWCRADDAGGVLTSDGLGGYAPAADGGRVHLWWDRSGLTDYGPYGNHLDGLQYTYAPALVYNAANGLPMVYFEPGPQRRLYGPAVGPGNTCLNATNLTIMVVNQRTGQDTLESSFLFQAGQDKFNGGATEKPAVSLGYIRGTGINRPQYFAADKDGNYKYYNASGGSVMNLNVMTLKLASTGANAANLYCYYNGSLISGLSPSTWNPSSVFTNYPIRVGWGKNAYGEEFHKFIGYLGEIVVFGRALGDAPRAIVENYLAAKYGLTLAAGDKYAGDTSSNGDYDFDVIGIGQEADGAWTNAAGAGLGLAPANGTLGNGEYLLAGHKTPANELTANGVPAGIASRWTRVWHVDKTGTLDATLAFDWSDGGVAGGFASGATHRLLYSASTALTFAVVGGAGSVAGDQVTFLVPNASLADGWYTLGVEGDTTAPSLAVLTPADLSYTTNSQVNVTGTAADASGVASVTVNGVGASTANGFANWNRTVTGLAVGTNVLTVVALDTPGNAVTNVLRLIYAAGDFDGNCDGLPDAWQIRHFGIGFAASTNAMPNADADGDRMSNRDEQLAGTDPNNKEDCLKLSAAQALPGSGFTVEWKSVSGHVYEVQWSTNLAGWTSFAPAITAAAPSTSATDAGAGQVTNRFYRVKQP